MGDDVEEPQSRAAEPQPEKIKAEDNPWYLLATLYGVPGADDHEVRNKNRIAWNRYFVTNLNPKTLTWVITEGRCPPNERTPLLEKELQEIEGTFAERTKDLKSVALPETGAEISFDNVQFDHEVDFSGYLFTRATSFSGATFSDEANSFERATFFDLADFKGAAFSSNVSFLGAMFLGDALFPRVTFSGVAKFNSATFYSICTFEEATFAFASFTGTTFFSYANFSKLFFHRLAYFVNAKLKQKTLFAGAIFKTKPPEFFGAELHQDTVWRGIIWPPRPRDNDEAGAFLDAYACLKLEMDRLKKHEDELDFFALELQSRRVLLGLWGWGLPIWLYGLFSDYGRSYVRPLVALFFLGLIATLAFLPSDSLSPWQSLGLSFASTLNVFGFRKDFFEPAVIACLPAWLDVVSAVQTIFGTVLLFLFGLGIRNKFRMK